MNYIPNLKYKTEMCQKWENKQFCPKGPNCYFAHGDIQLRTIQQNQAIISEQNKVLMTYNKQLNLPSNYKTIKCKFFVRGKCQLGKSCTFYHSQNQRRKPTKAQSQSLSHPQALSQFIQKQQINQVPYNYPIQYTPQWSWLYQSQNPYTYFPNMYNPCSVPTRIQTRIVDQQEEKMVKEAEDSENENPVTGLTQTKQEKPQTELLQASIETNESLEKNFSKLSI